jgi:hypothetical protein
MLRVLIPISIGISSVTRIFTSSKRFFYVNNYEIPACFHTLSKPSIVILAASSGGNPLILSLKGSGVTGPS